MKKWIALLLAVTVIVCLPACTQPTPVEQGKENAPEDMPQSTAGLTEELAVIPEPDSTETDTIEVETAQDPTEPSATQVSTEKPTEPATTQKPTEKPTEPPTTQKPTEKPTEPPTTQKPTEKPTEPPTTTPSPTEATEPVLPEYYPGTMAQEIVALINEERAKAGVDSVSLSNTYSRLAYVRAEEASRNWSHTRPNGQPWSTVFSDYNVSWGYGIAENLAYISYNDPKAVVDSWMNSEGHRRNMLNGSFTEIGIGVYVSGGNYYICTLYVA